MARARTSKCLELSPIEEANLRIAGGILSGLVQKLERRLKKREDADERFALGILRDVRDSLELFAAAVAARKGAKHDTH